MQDLVREVDRCRVCGQDDWLDVLSFGPRPLANGFLDPAVRHQVEPTYPLDVVACRDCWLMSLRQVVTPAALFRNYVYVSSATNLIRGHMRQVVDWCADRFALVPGDLVVELGSNVGSQLALFREGGFRTVGVDPAENLARVARDRGIETIADFFGPDVCELVAGRHGPAALVLGRQCLAHIDDVHAVLSGVDALLSPDGGLVVEVPYLLDLINENQFDTIYHEHLSYFSFGTLCRLFQRHGLRVVDVVRAPVHGGSIVVFAARAGSRHRPRPPVAELLALEQRSGLSTPRPYQDFAVRTRHLTDAVGRLVRDLVAGGARVAGYGAPSKGSALLQACGLGPAEVEFCSDTTELKHGKLVPGTGIPVCSPDEARSRRPDCYLLLAWNYADEIIRNEREFLQRGGKFIVPIPQPRIISAADVG